MRKPDFFIVGAAKSGTTSMLRYLNQHPDISMPQQREPVYFGSDYDWDQVKTASLEDYLSIFSTDEGCSRIGDKSVWYLTSSKAAKEIYEFNPDALIIVLLRNPLDMVHSLHSQLLATNDEDIADFGEALDAEEERKKGLNIPEKGRMPEALYYSEVARYAEQLSRYIDIFGNEKVLTLLYDDLKSDTRGSYARVLKFLGVDESFQPEFYTYNKKTKPRSVLLERMINSESRLRRVLPRQLYEGLEWRLNRWNQVPILRPKMHHEVRSRLQRNYQADVRDLEKLIGRDLSFWFDNSA